MPEKPKTRKATAAERLAARALGKPEPDEVELETRSAAEQRRARLLARQQAATGPTTAPGWGGEDSPPAA
ncbi:hypothetical protein [Streptomyces canus]|uniref:hypothetical protein n=1 Tax=Streptomyces canus TaxID=58343 RepID=UPI00036F437B|nr:hypothetical protein [Streptomyces canus]